VAGAGAGGVAAASDVWSVLQSRGVALGADAAAMAAVTQLAAESAVWREVRVSKQTLDEMIPEAERARVRVVKVRHSCGELHTLRLAAAPARCACVTLTCTRILSSSHPLTLLPSHPLTPLTSHLSPA
jgi:hypothetical protein